MGMYIYIGYQLKLADSSIGGIHSFDTKICADIQNTRLRDRVISLIKGCLYERIIFTSLTETFCYRIGIVSCHVQSPHSPLLPTPRGERIVHIDIDRGCGGLAAQCNDKVICIRYVRTHKCSLSGLSCRVLAPVRELFWENQQHNWNIGKILI